MHAYTILSDYHIHTNYQYSGILDLSNINIINELTYNVHSQFDCTYTDKNGETNNMFGYIKSFNKLNHTFNLHVLIKNEDNNAIMIR